MTGREFSGVDIDLLADYVGGALDGTPDEAVVAARVVTDPAWRAAHDALTVGMESVGAQLHALGAEPAVMPDEFATRLTAALANAASEPSAPSEPSEPGAPGEHPGRRHLSVVPDPGSSPPTTSGDQPAGVMASGDQPAGDTGARDAAAARRRRLRRWAAPIAAAAGVLAFAGVGIDYLLDDGRSETAQSTSAGAYRTEQDAPMLNPEGAQPERGGLPGAAQGNVGPSRLAEVPAAERITVSGTDYRRTSFADSARAPLHRSLPTPFTAEPPPAPASGRTIDEDSAAPELRRLSVREALLACLAAITVENGGGPASVSTVDYARFEGDPALVVRFTADNRDWAWVSGPDCGVPGAGADTRHRVRVG